MYYVKPKKRYNIDLRLHDKYAAEKTRNPKLCCYVLCERKPENKIKTKKYDILSQIVINVTTRTRKLHKHTDIANDNGEKVNTHFYGLARQSKEK